MILSENHLENHELNLRIAKLEKENIALKAKINLMYVNWNYDSKRFEELKIKYSLIKDNKYNNKDDSFQEVNNWIQNNINALN